MQQRKICLFLIILSVFVVVNACDLLGEQEFTLTIHVQPEKGGEVLTEGTVFPPDTIVTITPKAESGWELIEWGGENGDEVIKVNDHYQLLMDSDKEIIAHFADTLFVAEPTFSPEAGEYDGPLTIELVSATPKATIHYTLDQTTPSPTEGIVYTEPLLIEGNKTIKALAFKDGMVASEVVEADFLLYYKVLTQVEPSVAGEISLNPVKEKYLYGEEVTLEAIATENYNFSHWAGDLTDSENPQTITIDGPQEAIAHFSGTNAQLAELTISTGDLIPNFDPQTFFYNVVLAFAVTELELFVKTECPNALVKIDDHDFVQNEQTATIDLAVGENLIEVVVESEDEENTETYLINIERKVSADLAEIQLSKGVLDPVFNPDTLKYLLRVPFEGAELILYPQALDQEATIKIDGVELAEPFESRPYQLTVGETKGPIKIEVIARDESIAKTYQLEAFRSYWGYLGAPGFSEGGVVGVTMFVDNQIPYVSYNDNAYGYQSIIQKFDGTDWQQLGEIGDVNGDGISLIVHNGIPYIAYQDKDANAKTSVQKYEAGSWSFIGGQGFTPDLDWGHNLVITAAKDKYISYSDGPFGFGQDNGQLTVRKFDGLEWQIIGERRFTPNVVFSHDFTVIDQTPYVVYRDGSQGHRASAQYFDGEQWVYLGQPGFTVGGVEYVDLNVYDDQLYLVFRDRHRFDKLTVMTYQNDQWVYVGEPGFTSGTGAHPSLDFDEGGTIYVAYMDGAENSRASVKKFDGNSWQYVGDPGFTGGRGNGPTLVVDGTEIYVSVWDGGYGFRASVLQYSGH